MTKPFKTYEEQINLLKHRNIIIKNEKTAKRILARENYYQLINGYKSIFLDIVKTQANKEDFYKDNTTFEQIYALYCFDRNLRNILFKYILIAENSIRSQIAYAFSEKYSDLPFSYLNANNYHNTNPQNTAKLISDLSNIITTNTNAKGKSGAFYHYLSTHKELPLWVLVTKLTFGITCSLFYNLSKELKISILEQILLEYNKTKSKSTLDYNVEPYINDFMNLLNCIKRFRNICAHEERIYDYKAKNSTGKKYKSSHFYVENPPDFKGGFFDILLILRIFITDLEYQYMINSIINEMHVLKKELPASLYSKVFLEMCFPKNWEESILLHK